MNKKPIIIPCAPEHAYAMAPNLRKEDREELEAIGISALEGLLESVKIPGMAYTWIVDEKPICMFGCSHPEIISDIGMPWLLASQEIENHTIAFMRHYAVFMDRAKELYSFLENYIDARQVSTIRWLKRCGFTIHKAQPYGIMGLPFHRFTLEV